MRVVDIRGDEICVDSIQDLESVLQRRGESGANHFWLAHDDKQFPVLSFLVTGDVAALHYIPADREAGWRSVGTRGDGLTRFAISQHPADDVFILNEALVPFSAAVEAAKEFLLSDQRPTSVDWFEL
jgi:hypothetical protein